MGEDKAKKPNDVLVVAGGGFDVDAVNSDNVSEEFIQHSGTQLNDFVEVFYEGFIRIINDSHKSSRLSKGFCDAVFGTLFGERVEVGTFEVFSGKSIGLEHGGKAVEIRVAEKGVLDQIGRDGNGLNGVVKLTVVEISFHEDEGSVIVGDEHDEDADGTVKRGGFESALRGGVEMDFSEHVIAVFLRRKRERAGTFHGKGKQGWVKSQSERMDGASRDAVKRVFAAVADNDIISAGSTALDIGVFGM